LLEGIRLSLHFSPEKNRGRIVFISSESALNVPTEISLYVAPAA